MEEETQVGQLTAQRTPTNEMDVQEIVETPESPDFETGGPEVDVDDLGQTPIQTPEEPETETEILDTIRSLSEVNPQERQMEQQLREIEDQFIQTLDEPSRRAREEARLEEQQGVSDMEQQIVDLNKSAQLKASQLTQELEELGQQGFRATAVRGQKARARRQVAAEIEGINAAIEAAQGNIAAADSRIDRALRRKYGDTEANIQRAQQMLQVNQNRFTRGEKRRARERETELAIAQSQLEQRRAEEKSAMQTVNSAIQSGVLSAQRGGKLMESVVNGQITPEQAQAEAGALVGGVAAEQRALENQAARAQIASLGGGTGAGTGAAGAGTGAIGFDDFVSFDDLSKEQIGKLSGSTRTIIQNPQAFKDLTPTIKGQVLDELGSAGIDASPLFPDPSRQNAARAAFTVVRDGQTAIDLMKEPGAFFNEAGEAKTNTFDATRRAVTSRIPGTDVYETTRAIQSVKDNIGIDALLNIKREGSGLGQVPQRQLETLQGLLGRLEVTRSPNLLERDLSDALRIYQDILSKSGDEITEIMSSEVMRLDRDGTGLQTPTEQIDEQPTIYQTDDGTQYIEGEDGLYYPVK